MDGNEHAPTKKELLERLLGKGMVMVHLDARQNGVDVPSRFDDDADLRLNLSYRFSAGDLFVGDEEVQATLSFSGQPFLCRLPMGAIFAMVSHVTGETFFFPGDAPPEALAALAAVVRETEEEAGETSEGEPPSEDETSRRPGRPRLTALPGGQDAGEAADEAPPASEGSEDPPEAEAADATEDAPPSTDESGDPRLPPYLRVVK